MVYWWRLYQLTYILLDENGLLNLFNNLDSGCQSSGRPFIIQLSNHCTIITMCGVVLCSVNDLDSVVVFFLP